ncbi:hypothetical protein M9Y10_021113 [Tritrichomonas musculus]|uniref:Cytoplasmic envelopment protein 3 n=1 Tax=Tritrichomonas musculus TaxID=1915356 RepID=A0ABR2HFB1_9EUKA
MGICSSCCDNIPDESSKIDSQYASLVTVKPSPITLEEIQNISDEKMDVPMFATVESDEDENPAVSDPETLTDTELNLYAKKLDGSDGDEQEKED